MTPRQQRIFHAAEPAIHAALFSRRKRQVPPHDRPLGKNPLDQDVGAEVHVVMPIKPVGSLAVVPLVFFQLTPHNVIERIHQRRLKQDGRIAMRAKESRNLMLMFNQKRRDVPAGERSGEIQMKTCIDINLACYRCGSLRRLHEYHGAYRRHGASPDAIKNAIRGFEIPAPVIRVHDYDRVLPHIIHCRRVAHACRQRVGLVVFLPQVVTFELHSGSDP